MVKPGILRFDGSAIPMDTARAPAWADVVRRLSGGRCLEIINAGENGRARGLCGQYAESLESLFS